MRSFAFERRTDATPTQLDKVEQAARELGTGDDPERFRERVGKFVKHNSMERGE